jgi:predicted Fe-S protein YdhL (DUF1289 family)
LKEDLRRGKARPPSTVISPCIKVCTFDESGEYCIGCFRTATEMRDWYIMTDDEKNKVLERIANE